MWQWGFMYRWYIFLNKIKISKDYNRAKIFFKPASNLIYLLIYFWSTRQRIDGLTSVRFQSWLKVGEYMAFSCVRGLQESHSTQHKFSARPVWSQCFLRCVCTTWITRPLFKKKKKIYTICRLPCESCSNTETGNINNNKKRKRKKRKKVV